MKQRIFIGAVLGIFLSVSLMLPLKALAAHYDAAPFIRSYAFLAYINYRDLYQKTLRMQEKIDAFLRYPKPRTLEEARQAWLEARTPYAESEVFRFYGGPIDFRNMDVEGPQRFMDAWPINAAYIDYVKGHPKEGFINDSTLPLMKEVLRAKHQQENPQNVTLGWHAIEFLLWGEAVKPGEPGARDFKDYISDNKQKERRRIYLKLIVDMLVADTKLLMESWNPSVAGSYGDLFCGLPPEEALAKILTGMATLSGFELASVRLAVPLESGERGDTPSPFSNNNDAEFAANNRGIKNLYLGKYASYKVSGLQELAQKISPQLNASLLDAISASEKALLATHRPFDMAIRTAKGSPEKQQIEKAITALRQEADLLKQLGKKLGVEVQIVR